MWAIFLPPWLNDAIWQHRSYSILVQVMACCLMGPSPCLNQCWHLISEILWCSRESNLTAARAQAVILYNESDGYTSKVTAKGSMFEGDVGVNRRKFSIWPDGKIQLCEICISIVWGCYGPFRYQIVSKHNFDFLIENYIVHVFSLNPYFCFDCYWTNDPRIVTKMIWWHVDNLLRLKKHICVSKFSHWSRYCQLGPKGQTSVKCKSKY